MIGDSDDDVQTAAASKADWKPIEVVTAALLAGVILVVVCCVIGAVWVWVGWSNALDGGSYGGRGPQTALLLGDYSQISIVLLLAATAALWWQSCLANTTFDESGVLSEPSTSRLTTLLGVTRVLLTVTVVGAIIRVSGYAAQYHAQSATSSTWAFLMAALGIEGAVVVGCYAVHVAVRSMRNDLADLRVAATLYLTES